MECKHKEKCLNYPQKCNGCGQISDINNHYPLFKTRDLVEVVRCKDCQFAEVNGGDCHGVITITTRNYILELNETRYIPLDFCSYGKRKEGAEE